MRTWLCVAALLILPLLVYWPTVTHEYGFRDDYAHLREVRERPGWLTTLTTAHGRPVYGAALEASLQAADRVTDLTTLRAISALLIGLVGVLLWWQLRRSGWTDLQAATIGAAVTLLPGAQVVVGWAIAWPVALGLVAALAGFALVEHGFAKTGIARAALVAAGGVLYVIAGTTYQTSALFAVVPLVAVLLLREGTTTRRDALWVTAHIGVLFVALVAGFLVATALMTPGAVPEATRTTPRARHLAEVPLVPAQPAAELDRAVRAARPLRDAALVLVRRRGRRGDHGHGLPLRNQDLAATFALVGRGAVATVRRA